MTDLEKVVVMGKEKRFSKEGELARRIHELVHEYDGEISLVAAIGILEMEKNHLMGLS